MFSLFFWQGIDTITNILTEAGFILLFVCPFAVPDQYLGSEAWRILFPPNFRPHRLKALLASWIGSSVNTLMPVATIGGEIVKARIIVLLLYSSTKAAATITVDKTVQAIAVLIWGLIGAILLLIYIGPSAIVTGIFISSGILAIGIFGFIIVQIKGGFTKIAQKLTVFTGQAENHRLKKSTLEFQHSIEEIYKNKNRIVLATILRLHQRIILVGEIVLASHIFGTPIGIMEAMILKGIIGAIRGLSFAIPAGLGIQEGGYVAIGALIGHPPDLMIAISLTTRLREILPNIPLLFLWQILEGRSYNRYTNDKKN